MKRKVIQLAGKTAVVSLPHSWVKKFGIKKGDDLELNEKGNELILSVVEDFSIKKVQVDLTGADRRVSRLILSSLHRKGFDEIEILCGSKEQLDEINTLVKDVMLGFVAVEQTSKKVLYKNLYVDRETDFESLLRRIFLITLKLSEEVTKRIDSGDFENIDYLLEMETMNNKLTNFCERIICKSFYSSSELVPFNFIIVWNLEKVADQYKYICKHLAGNKHILDKETIKLAYLTNTVLNKSYDLYYNFNFEKMTKLNTMIDESITSFSTKPTKIDYYLLGVMERIKDFFTSIIAIRTY